MLPRITLLGSSGMLSLGVQDALDQLGIAYRVLGRTTLPLGFDAASSNAVGILKRNFQRGDVVINCVGLTKAQINSSSLASRSKAIRVNSLFPIELARAAEERGFRVIQPATDCVFSGEKGDYAEDSAHDAQDVYGMTKSLGESQSVNVTHLRCSLIGREAAGRSTLLYNWVTTQPKSAQISGFTNHMWNGLTNQAFGRVVGGILIGGLELAGVIHLVPGSQVTKAELVELIAKREGRTDITIIPEPAPTSINRTLSTSNQALNHKLFALAGYAQPPSIAQMIDDLI